MGGIEVLEQEDEVKAASKEVNLEKIVLKRSTDASIGAVLM